MESRIADQRNSLGKLLAELRYLDFLLALSVGPQPDGAELTADCLDEMIAMSRRGIAHHREMVRRRTQSIGLDLTFIGEINEQVRAEIHPESEALRL